MRPPRKARVAAVVLAATFAACGNQRRANLQIVVHARETPTVFHYPAPEGIRAGVRYDVHWSMDLVETGGRSCTLTAIDVIARVPGRPDQIRHETPESPDFYGVTNDSRPDYYLRVDPAIPAYETRKVASSYWSVGWNGLTPDTSTLTLDITVRYRDSAGERLSHVTAGPGLKLD